MLLEIFLILLPLCLLAYLFISRDPHHQPFSPASVAARLDQLLPQTQCGRCGFPGCLPYARAIAAGEVEINLCSPGGNTTIRHLAEMLGREPIPLPQQAVDPPGHYAWIDDQQCIGCVKCILACPVDAIVGAAKQIHTVIPDLCTGCELCIKPCPVDCIVMTAADNSIRHWGWTRPQRIFEHKI